MNSRFKAPIILLVCLFNLFSCADKEEENRRQEEELAQIKAALEQFEEDIANSSTWTDQNSKVFKAQSVYDPFTGFTQHALLSPVGETNRAVSGAKRYSRLVIVCSTDPDADDFMLFYFDTSLALSEKFNENKPESNNYATNYSWVGYQQIKAWDEVKSVKLIQQLSSMEYLYVVEDQQYIIQSAMSLSNSDEPMLLKVELALDSALTYYSYVFTDFITHYTTFKNTCP